MDTGGTADRTNTSMTFRNFGREETTTPASAMNHERTVATSSVAITSVPGVPNSK